MNILLAGEDEFTLKFLKVKFEEAQFTVDVVAVANDALKMLEEKKYQVVIIDFAMQVQNSFLDEFAKMPSRPPVIVLSLLKEETDIQKTLKHGVNLFINKEHVQMQDIVDATQSILHGEPLPEKSGYHTLVTEQTSPLPAAQADASGSAIQPEASSLSVPVQADTPTAPPVERSTPSEVNTPVQAEPPITPPVNGLTPPEVAAPVQAAAIEQPPLIEPIPVDSVQSSVENAEVVGPDQPSVDVQPGSEVGDHHPHTGSDSDTEIVDVDAEAV
jgi:DNA-binding NarL/FixJ family response regulator